MFNSLFTREHQEHLINVHYNRKWRCSTPPKPRLQIQRMSSTETETDPGELEAIIIIGLSWKTLGCPEHAEIMQVRSTPQIFLSSACKDPINQDSPQYMPAETVCTFGRLHSVKLMLTLLGQKPNLYTPSFHLASLALPVIVGLNIATINTSYDNADKDMDSSLKTNPCKPAKGTDAFYKQVLHPQGINIGPDYCNPRTTKYIQSKPIDKRALGRAFVSFSPKELVKSLQAAKEAAYNEAQWTINVYHPYFLLSNCTFEGRVRRQPQHPLFWCGTKPNICLPLLTVFDRRSSGLAPCTKIWE
jgi:hypothetical protein